jgi:small-conductance mechanosensitive channel
MFDHVPITWLPPMKDGIYALIIVVLAAILYSLINRFIKVAKARGNVSEPVAAIFRVGMRWILIPLTMLMVLEQFGILHDFWTWLLGAIALIAIGFVAQWSILSNMLCTLLILIYKPFHIGEKIEIPTDNVVGTVVDINLFFTTLREAGGDQFQVPNNLFFQKTIRRSVEKQKVDLYDQLLKKEPTE